MSRKDLKTTERAYTLAETGEFQSLEALRAKLAKDGYQDVETMTDGPLIGPRLREIIRSAKSRRHADH